MATRKKAQSGSRVLRELLDSAHELSSYGVLSKREMARMNVLCEEPPEYTPERVIAIRTRVAKTSQAVFASMLNVSVSTVQKWESPTAHKRPSGPSARLLQLVERNGIALLQSFAKSSGKPAHSKSAA